MKAYAASCSCLADVSAFQTLGFALMSGFDLSCEGEEHVRAPTADAFAKRWPSPGSTLSIEVCLH